MLTADNVARRSMEDRLRRLTQAPDTLAAALARPSQAEAREGRWNRV